MALKQRVAGKRRRLITQVVYFRGPVLASALRKRWAKFKNPRATIEFGKDTYCGPGFSLHMPFGGTFVTGEGVEFRRNFRAELGKNGRIEIGARSYLTYDVIISCDTVVSIGERCGLAQSTYVADGSHKYRDLDEEFLNQGYDYRPIRIEDDAQIHSKCTIVNSIGHRAVIGANAVVSREIPPYCLAAGVPARVIDYFGPPGQEPPGWEPRERSEPEPAEAAD